MSEIKMPANVEHAVTVDEEHDSPVVSCYEPKAEKVEEVVEAASASDTPDALLLKKIKKKKLHQITKKKVSSFFKMTSLNSPPLLIVGLGNPDS